MGDFNAILGQHEKWGGQLVVSSLREGFYQLKLNHGMVDMGSTGSWFTWCNGQRGYQ